MSILLVLKTLCEVHCLFQLVGEEHKNSPLHLPTLFLLVCIYFYDNGKMSSVLKNDQIFPKIVWEWWENCDAIMAPWFQEGRENRAVTGRSSYRWKSLVPLFEETCNSVLFLLVQRLNLGSPSRAPMLLWGHGCSIDWYSYSPCMWEGPKSKSYPFLFLENILIFATLDTVKEEIKYIFHITCIMWFLSCLVFSWFDLFRLNNSVDFTTERCK